MKKILGIIILGFLLGGSAYAEIINRKCSEYKGYGDYKKSYVYPNNLNFRIDTDKKTYEWKTSAQSKWTKMVILEWNGTTIKAKDPDPAHDSTTELFDFANLKMEMLEGNKKIKGHMQLICDRASSSNNTQSAGISFTIKDKKEQCAAIGFKPATDKFADCVLRLVELDLQKQISNPTIVAQDSGNKAIVDELKRSNNMQQSQFLMNLSNQLLNPSSPASSMSSSSCTVRGGTIKTINCW